MENVGLSTKELEEIVDVIKKHCDVDSAFVFGSRAKGTYKSGSDVDIAIKGKNITIDTVAKILTELEEETMLPYFFDVVHYDTCSTKELVEHIDRIGICIFNKQKISLNGNNKSGGENEY